VAAAAASSRAAVRAAVSARSPRDLPSAAGRPVQALLDASTWFAGFHVIQRVLTGLVALTVLLLAADFGRTRAWTARLSIGLFLVFFSAYDTLAGIGTGLAMRSARDLSAAQQEGVFTVVKDWPGLGPPFVLSIVGTLGWGVAVGTHALARRLGASRPEWIMLALAAVFVLGGHPFPQGTLASGSLFAAVLFHEWWPLGLAAAAAGNRPPPRPADAISHRRGTEPAQK